MYINLLKGMKDNHDETKDINLEMMLSFLVLAGASKDLSIVDELEKTDITKMEVKFLANGIEMSLYDIANRLIGIFNEKQQLENEVKEINTQLIKLYSKLGESK